MTSGANHPVVAPIITKDQEDLVVPIERASDARGDLSVITLKVFRHLHTLRLRFHFGRRTGRVAHDVEHGGTTIADLLDWTLYSILPIALQVFLVTVVKGTVTLTVWPRCSYGHCPLNTLVGVHAFLIAQTQHLWRDCGTDSGLVLNTRNYSRLLLSSQGFDPEFPIGMIVRPCRPYSALDRLE